MSTSDGTIERPADRADDVDSSDDTARSARAQRRVTIELTAALVLMALAVALRWIDSTTPSVVPVLQAVGGTVGPAVFIGVLAALTRRWRVTAAAGVLVIAQVAIGLPWWLPGDHATTAAGDPLVVMAANVQYGRADPAALIAAVRTHDVDVLTVSEGTGSFRDDLADRGLTEQLPHVVDRSYEDCAPAWTAAGDGSVSGCVTAAGSLIYSRHPLVDGHVSTPPDTMFEAPVATIAAPGGEVVVLAAHPVPPVGRASDWWRAELATLVEWADDIPRGVPLVIAGDLNASDAHPALRRVADAGLYDAHREIGDGPVATWPRSGLAGVPMVPLFHLDHVLARDLDVADAGTMPLPGSDHDAVWAALVPPSDRG
jgi:endonuclease/exonuclease/phosphatase (EEP) superfamily protein YafD